MSTFLHYVYSSKHSYYQQHLWNSVKGSIDEHLIQEIEEVAYMVKETQPKTKEDIEVCLKELIVARKVRRGDMQVACIFAIYLSEALGEAEMSGGILELVHNFLKKKVLKHYQFFIRLSVYAGYIRLLLQMEREFAEDRDLPTKRRKLDDDESDIYEDITDDSSVVTDNEYEQDVTQQDAVHTREDGSPAYAKDTKEEREEAKEPDPETKSSGAQRYFQRRHSI